MMRGFTTFAFALLAASVRASDDEPSHTTPAPACTATSTTGSGAYFDLRPDIAWPEDDEKAHRYAQHKDYHARGYDYGKNFTINICNSVVDPLTDVVGLEESQWQNVSAYYMSHGDIYSIGSESKGLRTRGRKLLLQYTGGSPCGGSGDEDDDDARRNVARFDSDSVLYHDGQHGPMEHIHEAGKVEAKSGGDNVRRKSTTISFLCDRDPGTVQTTISFVGTDPDECAYFFEARSQHACASAEPHKPGSVGPGSVFGVVVLIAVLVYFLGGIFFNRTVNHARGWRQLPNYSLWAGIWSFLCDMVVITMASCARFFPGRRGYSSLRSGPSTRDSEQEAQRNALIDQLDEEWDD
ncbi:putative vacuolar sorting receptor [Emericellopsis atlantica]|uniref:Vacuolar sorting receptor n=1 Tax=Emericellopsis atlantica TaxID=2614577 RepID=A0A9P7ZSP9_9HYPO|nr:putative vacuolar sorting receptor [Emericellopsis atlantica]KAG9257137.1 putative vacuolar sorting receptor [Emericellopsis atlantica]